MLAKVLGPLERLRAPQTSIRLEGNVDLDVGSDMVALLGLNGTSGPTAVKIQVLLDLPADMIVADVRLRAEMSVNVRDATGAQRWTDVELFTVVEVATAVGPLTTGSLVIALDRRRSRRPLGGSLVTDRLRIDSDGGGGLCDGRGRGRRARQRDCHFSWRCLGTILECQAFCLLRAWKTVAKPVTSRAGLNRCQYQAVSDVLGATPVSFAAVEVRMLVRKV